MTIIYSKGLVPGLIHCLVKSTGGQYSSNQHQPRSVPGLWAWPCQGRVDICCGRDHQVGVVSPCNVCGGGSGGGEHCLVSECQSVSCDERGQPGVCCKLSQYITTLQHHLTSHQNFLVTQIIPPSFITDPSVAVLLLLLISGQFFPDCHPSVCKLNAPPLH